jgi:hypothetical protein
VSTTTSLIQVLGPMVTTGLAVSKGDRLRVSCVGFVDEGDHNLGRIQVDGDGHRPNGGLADDGPADDSYPLSGGIRYALIGGIFAPGTSVTFPLGRMAQTLAPASGILFLGANDHKPGDNTVVPGRSLPTPWVVSVDHIVPDPPPPLATPGLRISDIQITQVAQAQGGGSLLVGAKTTTVRAFLTTPNPLPAGTQVNGIVRVHPFQRPVSGQINALNPTGAPNAVQVALVGQVVNANQTAAALNFEVPGSVLQFVEGVPVIFEVTAFIGVEKAAGDGFAHTDQRSAGFERPGAPFIIRHVGVRTPVNTGRGGTPVDPNLGTLFGALHGIETRLPVPDGSMAAIAALPGTITMDIDVGGSGGGYNEVLARLVFLRLFQVVHPDLFIGGTVMGVVAPTPPPLPAGGITNGIQTGSTVIVGLYPAADVIAAHELCHTLGLAHAASPGCLTPSHIDTTLPSASQAPGWSTITQTVVPTGTPALMGYCSTKWPTEEEYSRCYRTLAER